MRGDDVRPWLPPEELGQPRPIERAIWRDEKRAVLLIAPNILDDTRQPSKPFAVSHGVQVRTDP